VEHVGESLEGLAERIDTSDPPAGTAALIHLQRAQIEEARRTFLDSVARIRTDLGAMHAETADLVRVARDVNGENSGNKADAAKGVVGHCAAVVAALDEWSSSRRSLGEATGQVADGCARVGAFVSDIQNVGTRLLRLALNAQVEAVRLSDSGAVMEAVAEGIRSVSQQASSHAQHAGEALALAQEAVNGFAGGLGANDKASCGAAEIAAGRIRGLGGGLADSAARSGQLMAAILQNGEELSHSIAELIHGLTADSVMGQVVDRCLETLIEVEKLAGRVTPRHCPDGALESQPGTGAYTMQDERAVHAATTGRTAEASGAAQDAVDQSVELF
jgi:methyl-accepting chemotaxis protein